MVADRYLSIKTHLAAFMAADCDLSIKTLIIFLVGNKFYQQVQQQLFGGLVVLRENKLSTKLHKFIGNIFSGIGLCPKNGK